MMLKSLCFVIFFTVVQCWQLAKTPSDGGDVHIVNLNEANTDSNVPPEGFISHGKRARMGEFPWMTFIETIHSDDRLAYKCGGSLISKRHVITAAHCVVDAEYYEDITVIVGEYLTNSFARDCVDNRCVENHKTHPDQVTWHNPYDAGTLSNDIAVLRLKEHVKSKYIRPISLPPFDIDDPKYENAPLTLAGWGRTENSSVSQILLKTEINLKTREQCHRIYNYSYPDGHLCAGSTTFEDSCTGDSGGPLMMYYQKKYYISGIVSFSWFGRCGDNPASYYTNVYKYLEWIRWAMQR